MKEEILNKGMVLATRYVSGEMNAVVKQASKDVAIAVSTLICLPVKLQNRFAEKIIERKSE